FLDGSVRIAGLMIFVAGCFPPALGEGRIACGTGGACPPGYMCNVNDNHCYTSGHAVAAADLSMAGDLGDSGVSHDLAGTMTSTDMARVSGGCGPTVSRVCTDLTHSASCVLSGGSWQAVPDRKIG